MLEFGMKPTLVRAGQPEAIYSGMPRWGLGRIGALLPASGPKESARSRVLRDGSADARRSILAGKG
jgi:hypothetical protein